MICEECQKKFDILCPGETVERKWLERFGCDVCKPKEQEVRPLQIHLREIMAAKGRIVG